MSDDLFSDHQDFILRRAAAAARRLARSLRLGRDHEDDFRQELLLDLWRRLHRHDASLSPVEAYASLLLKRQAIELAKRHRRQRLDVGEPLSLYAAAGDDEDLLLLDVLDADACLRRAGRRETGSWDALDLCLDLAAIMERLPDDLLAILLSLDDGPAAAARSNGCHRATVHRAIQKLRRVFEAAGLKDYLQPGCDNDGTAAVLRKQGRRGRRSK